MKKQIAIAALTFGAVLLSASAFAAGRAPNDGGPVDTATPPSSKPIYNSVPAAPAHYGRGLNDGGIVDNVNGRAPNIEWAKYPPHIGRGANDGGF